MGQGAKEGGRGSNGVRGRDSRWVSSGGEITDSSEMPLEEMIDGRVDAQRLGNRRGALGFGWTRDGTCERESRVSIYFLFFLIKKYFY